MVRIHAALIAAALVLSGCYTTKTALTGTVRTIHVAPVENAIDLSAEISDRDRFRVYRPGLEVDITNAVINRFIFDGSLKVAGPGADAVFRGKLLEYRRDPLRYSEGDDVQEYRLNIVIDASVATAAGKDLWSGQVVGDTTFFLTGSRATSEDEALARAVEDLARRVVEKTVELW
ncbi:MAG: hypothetical protein A3D28_01790 [Omnitrophica bacterium RIFCSPHIGHO2_02_FULL_63_14]|nr:MAG: hypothetical protein A3D28_01790 [Omnitrophica bacterium RIFCSPHIGHO2_02_FULL_63_14]